MKRLILILSAVIMSLTLTTVNAQTVTKKMAEKVGYLCLSNQTAFARFANSIGAYDRGHVDAVLRNLSNHLDYAERFIIFLYDVYGEEMTYWALRDCLTVDELRTAKKLYEKVEDERRVLKEEEEERQKILLKKNIESGHYFTNSELAVQPIINLDIQKIVDELGVNRGGGISLSLDCKLPLNPKDFEIERATQKNYSDYEKSLLELIEEQVRPSDVKVGYVEFEGEKKPVNSIVYMLVTESREELLRYGGSKNKPIEVIIKKEIRKGIDTCKIVKFEGNSIRYIANKTFDGNKFISALYKEMKQDEELKNLPKGSYKLSITVLIPSLGILVNDEAEKRVDLPYLLSIKCEKFSF